MIATHSIRRAFFSCAVLVPIAALAAETSAQSRPTPARPLSDAIVEMLGSPFHVASAPALTTAGGATLGGGRFLKAIGGSALGYLGSFVFYGGMTSVLDGEDLRDLPAERAGMVLLHYDADFDRIGAVTGQAMEWVVERGSV